jgi:hypothetical protein
MTMRARSLATPKKLKSQLFSFLMNWESSSIENYAQLFLILVPRGITKMGPA